MVWSAGAAGCRTASPFDLLVDHPPGTDDEEAPIGSARGMAGTAAGSGGLMPADDGYIAFGGDRIVHRSDQQDAVLISWVDGLTPVPGMESPPPPDAVVYVVVHEGNEWEFVVLRR